jgi:hypothetical protein
MHAASFGNAKSQKEQNKTKTTKNIERQQNMVSLRLPDGTHLLAPGRKKWIPHHASFHVLLFIRNKVL